MKITMKNCTDHWAKSILSRVPVKIMTKQSKQGQTVVLSTVQCLCCPSTFKGFETKGRSKGEFMLRRCVEHRQTNKCSVLWPAYRRDLATRNESELSDDSGDHSSDSIGSHQLEEDEDVGEDNEEIMVDLVQRFVIAPAPPPSETDDTVDDSMRPRNESELGDDAQAQRAEVGGDHSSDSVGSPHSDEEEVNQITELLAQVQQFSEENVKLMHALKASQEENEQWREKALIADQSNQQLRDLQEFKVKLNQKCCLSQL